MQTLTTPAIDYVVAVFHNATGGFVVIAERHDGVTQPHPNPAEFWTVIGYTPWMDLAVEMKSLAEQWLTHNVSKLADEHVDFRSLESLLRLFLDGQNVRITRQSSPEELEEFARIAAEWEANPSTTRDPPQDDIWSKDITWTEADWERLGQQANDLKVRLEARADDIVASLEDLERFEAADE